VKIDININPNEEELRISVSCPFLTSEVEKLIAALRMMNRQLTVSRDGETYLLEIEKVIYIEAVERKCFVYTEEAMYESGSRLYELEQSLADCGFVRVSKACIVNMKAIVSLKSEINRRIRLTLSSGEQLIASRQYADELKRILGLKL